MTKIVTSWRTRNGSDIVTDYYDGFSLLLEDGGTLLLEDGGSLMLESSLVTPKSPVDWTDATKVVTGWQERDGYSISSNDQSVIRYTESGVVRLLEDGTTRYTEDVIFTVKEPTEWTE